MSTLIRPLLFAFTALSLLIAGGCDPASEDSRSEDHRMVFLPAGLRLPPATPPSSYVLHPPYWSRIHRDSVWLVVDHPIPAKAYLKLEIRILDLQGIDTLYLSYFGLEPDSAGRSAIRFAAYSREAWSAPAVLDLILHEVTATGVGLGELAARRWRINPDIGQLDLQPFPGHFHLEPEGLTLLYETETLDRAGGLETRLEIMRLAHLSVLPDRPEDHCVEDSVVRHLLQTMPCPKASDATHQATLQRCADLLDKDQATGGGLSSSREVFLCAGPVRQVLDSAEVANRKLLVEHRFGKVRLFETTSWGLTGGNSGTYITATGLGVVQSISNNGVSATQTTTRLLAVK